MTFTFFFFAVAIYVFHMFLPTSAARRLKIDEMHRNLKKQKNRPFTLHFIFVSFNIE